MPSTVDAVRVILNFIVPGYIIDHIISRSVLRAPRGNTEAILTYIVWSTISTAFSSLVVAVAWIYQGTVAAVWLEALNVLAPILIVPVLIGAAAAVVLAKVALPNEVRKVFDWLGLLAFHPAPKAWDWVFAKRDSCWVIVTLTDGTMVGGKFGKNSFASSYPAPEDIFIEEVWRLVGKGRFMDAIPSSQGVLIKGDKIRQIEFFH